MVNIGDDKFVMKTSIIRGLKNEYKKSKRYDYPATQRRTGQ